jgi:hypothetical protein
VSGTTERPRLAVFRSNQHIYAQVRAACAAAALPAGGAGSGWQCNLSRETRGAG